MPARDSVSPQACGNWPETEWWRYLLLAAGNGDKEDHSTLRRGFGFCWQRTQKALSKQQTILFQLTEVQRTFFLYINFVNTAGMRYSINHNVISGNYSFPAYDNGGQWQYLAVSDRKYFPHMALSWGTDYFANASCSVLVISRKSDLLILTDSCLMILVDSRARAICWARTHFLLLNAKFFKSPPLILSRSN